MLDVAWELLGKYFHRSEVGIKESILKTYWKGE